MSLVFPIALGGLVLIGVPILLHLIYRQKPRTLLFPAFRFLLQRQRTNLRKLRLRRLLLLALRVLIIAAIIFSLARPQTYSTRTGPAAVVLVFDTSPRMGYKSTDGATRLDVARDKALKLLAALHPDSKILVLDAGAPPSEKDGKGSEEDKPRDWVASVSQARDLIAGMKIRSSSPPIHEQVRHGLERLDELARNRDDAAGRGRPRFLCVFSDRTRGSWSTEGQEQVAHAVSRIPPTYEGMKSAHEDLPELVSLLKELRTRLPALGGSAYAEQGFLDALSQLQGELVSLSPEDVPFAASKLAPVATVQQQGRELLRVLGPVDKEKKDAAEEYRARLVQQVDKVLHKLRGVQCLYFDVGLEDPADLMVVRLETPKAADGTAKYFFGAKEEWKLRAVVKATGKDMPAKIVCKLPLKEGDRPLELAMDCPADKETTVEFPIESDKLKWEGGFAQIEVALVKPDQLAFNDVKYLTVGLAEEKKAAKKILLIAEAGEQAFFFETALVANGHEPDRKTPDAAAKVAKLPYDAVFLFQVREPGEELWKALDAYVAGGGALGVIPGRSMVRDEGAAGGYEGPIAKRLVPATLKGVEKGAGVSWFLKDEMIFLHPLIHPFRDWRTPRIDFFRDPHLAKEYWEAEPRPGAQILVRYADKGNRPALLEFPPDPKAKRNGKVLLFTTPLDGEERLWTNYLESSFFVVLIGLSTKHLVGELEPVAMNFFTHQAHPPYWKLTNNKAVGFVLKGPDGLRRNLLPPDKGDVLYFGEAKTPGNYQLDAVGGSRAGAFSLNLPPVEGDVSRLDVRTVEDVLGSGAVLPLNTTRDMTGLLEGYNSEPDEWLPWLLLAALLFLAGENLLANLFYRKEARAEAEITA